MEVIVEYYQIKNLDKYQPTYKDNRRLIWIRWYLDSMTDYRFAKLNPQQKWLFIGMTMLQVKEQGHLPKDHDWICHQLQYDKKHITNDIKVLQELGMVVTFCDELSQDVTKCDLDKIIKDKRRGKLQNVTRCHILSQPPTIEEVSEYCASRKNNIDAVRFVDYYTARGWMIGKNKMKDWKAAVRTWERNHKQEGGEIEHKL